MKPILGLLGSLGVGAGLMYYFDPQRGRSRRALVRDQLVHLQHKAAHVEHVIAADATNRVHGLMARSKLVFGNGKPAVENSTLVERVRARMGHCVSHPRAIAVSADRGTVTLSGPILVDEVVNFCEDVARVPGVMNIENLLSVYDHTSGHPALGGDVKPRRARHWSPAERALAGGLGMGLMANCLAQRSLISTLLGAVGFGLMLRASVNSSIREEIEKQLAMPAMETSPVFAVAAAGPVL